MAEIEIPLGLDKWAVETPLAAALAAPGRAALTYSGLLKHLKFAREAFCQAGVRPGTVAALALPNGPELVTAALAITMQSACTPFDLSLTGDESRLYLARIRAAALICEDSADSPVVDAARELGMRVIRIRSSASAPAGVFELAAAEGPADRVQGRHTGAAFLFHTSSTTDTPKLVPRSRTCVRVAASQDAEALQLRVTDRFLSLMPLCHGHGISAIFTQLVCGGSAFCPPHFEADGLLAWLEEFRPTWFSADPTLQRVILALAQRNPEAFRRIPLRFIRSAGAPPGPDVIQSLEECLGVPVLDGYGLTEIPSVTRNTPSRRKPGSVGTSTGTEVAIMDESGNLLPAGTEGEVVARGPTLMPGYLDNPDANLSAFHNGWFRTGDIGRIDRDGFLFIIGRRKEMINRGGKKIVPQEVDHALAKHPALAEAAAFAIPHRTLGEEVAAAAVLRPGAQVTELEVRRFAAEHLAPYKIPRRVVFVGAIPRTATGKPKRNALAKQFLDLAERRARTRTGSREQPRPFTEVESKLIGVWQDVLGLKGIDIHDDFFDLGGDSLSAAIMLAQAAEHLGIGRSRLSEADFLDQPSIATLAKIVSDCAQDPDRYKPTPGRVVLLRTEGRRIPFFCFSTSDIEPYQLRHLSRELGSEQPFFAVCPPPALQQNCLLKMEELARQSAASIRAVREHGPYILGGYCQAGALAFETALQLMAEGEEVALLALFEARTPGYPKIARHSGGYTRHISRLLRFPALAEDRITMQDVLTHIREVFQIATRRIRAKAIRAAASVRPKDPKEETHWQAVVRREYVPRTFPAPIINFLAADVPVSTRILSDPRLGWQDFAERGFEVRWVPTDHLSIFAEDNAPLLAAELERSFESAGAALRIAPAGAALAACASAGVPWSRE
jgi:oxalate---CoA ligase